MSRGALDQRPRIFRRVQKFLFSPHKPGEGADGASPFGLTITDYRSTRLAQLTIDFLYVALNASDPFRRSAGADIGAETYDVRFVWCGRANVILTSNDHAFRKVDASRKVKFKASCFDNRPAMFGPANVSLQTLTKSSGQLC